MWSGPRNLSTAMMYSFAARGDCAVIDEPFYSGYLVSTGLEHPMRRQIVASQPRDPRAVSTALVGPIPDKQRYYYQKHMAHHVLPETPRRWMARVRNAFLIRHPARVIASYARKRENPTLTDIGFVQQAQLFDEIAQTTGGAPIVIDTTDIRAAPEAMIRKLCTALGMPFKPSMLHWPKGPKPYDGIWAAHWYGTVHQSTGFEAAEGALPELTGDYARLADQAMPYYQRLADAKLG
jgi:hypothetical protein